MIRGPPRSTLDRSSAASDVYKRQDDVTPYDFVVVVLQRFFELNPLEAEHVTYLAHISGVAYVTTLPRSEAEARVGRAHFAASLEGYPLTFSICLLYTSPSPRDRTRSRMPSSASKKNTEHPSMST